MGLSVNRLRFARLLALCAAASLCPASAGQGLDPRLPHPISADQLAMWFGPLLGAREGAWARALDAHSEYLRAQARFHREEVEPWVRAGEGRDIAEAALTPSRERARRRLLGRIEAIDGQLFDRLAGIAVHEVVPVVDWLRVNRQLVTCECGLDVQTQEVSFSLFSVSELAARHLPVVWSSPAAAGPLAAYDRQVLASGRAFLRTHRAWREAIESSSALGSPADDSEEAAGLPESAKLIDVLDDQGQEMEQPQPGAALEFEGDDPFWQAKGAALESLGRGAHRQVEAAMDPSTRLLFRIRLLIQVVDFMDRERQADDRRMGSRRMMTTDQPVRTSLWQMGSTLSQLLDPCGEPAVDRGELDAVAESVWSSSVGLTEELLRISWQRVDAQVGRRAPQNERQQADSERRRVAALRQLRPVVADGLDALARLPGQGPAPPQPVRIPVVEGEGILHALVEAIKRVVSDRAGRHWGRMLLDEELLAQAFDQRMGGETPDDSGSFDPERFASLMEDILAPPLTLARVAATLMPTIIAPTDEDGSCPSGEGADEGLAAEWPAEGRRGLDSALDPDQRDLLVVLAVLRADALSAAWPTIARVLSEIEERTRTPMNRAAVEWAIAAIRTIRQAVAGAEERLLSDAGSIVEGDDATLRLRLLQLSTRFQRAKWPLVHAPSMTVPLVQPVDLARVLLAEFGARQIEASDPHAAAAAALLARSDALLAATERTGEAFLELVRVASDRDFDREDSVELRRRTLRQQDLSAALLEELRLQRHVTEEIAARLPPDSAERIRRAISIVSVQGDLRESVEVDRTPLDHREWSEHEDATTIVAMAEWIEAERRRRLDTVADRMIRSVLEHGSMFGDDWKLRPTAHARINRELTWLRFEAEEIKIRCDMALAAVLPPSSSRSKGLAIRGLVGRSLPRERDVLLQIMNIGPPG
ncbi:MAG TPA: hypothetical protein PKC43_01165 [Phycisphaerales bacterium]|nr:hypothetical protein [Phycisphaerales bacterium]HMP36036.1 hypothetical protein [Phycisphaerales bacterium]